MCACSCVCMCVCVCTDKLMCDPPPPPQPPTRPPPQHTLIYADHLPVCFGNRSKQIIIIIIVIKEAAASFGCSGQHLGLCGRSGCWGDGAAGPDAAATRRFLFFFLMENRPAILKMTLMSVLIKMLVTINREDLHSAPSSI